MMNASQAKTPITIRSVALMVNHVFGAAQSPLPATKRTILEF